MESWEKCEEWFDTSSGFAPTRGEVYDFSTPGLWVWPGGLHLERDAGRGLNWLAPEGRQ